MDASPELPDLDDCGFVRVPAAVHETTRCG